MDSYAVAVIGGGFSGLVLACSLSENLKKRTIIFEKLDRLGKKILATGNGRGNFTNVKMLPENYHGGDPSFAEYALKTYDNVAIRRFFEKFGVLSVEENGRVFPASLQSNSIQDALRSSISAVTVKTGSAVTSVKRKGGKFALYVGGEVFFAENVVICAGGKASPHLGTDGSAYEICRALGHSVTDCYPTLVRMRVDKAETKGLSGVKHFAGVSLFDGDRLVKSVKGDFLFADGYASGNSVFSLSAYLPTLEDPNLRIDFLPSAGDEDLTALLYERVRSFPCESSSFLLSGVVHSALAYKVASRLFGKRSLKDLSSRDISSAVYALKNYRLPVTGAGAFFEAQVTHGGVRTRDVSDETMMSKLVSGLYFCGEILDIDGDCGGYNLQWAFSSARVAADNINERYNNR